MDIHRKLVPLVSTLVIAAMPAAALAAGHGTPPANHGTAHRPSEPGSQGGTHASSTPGPNAGLPAKAKAYGVYCRGESKQHVAGQHGTPFSQCVTAMAKLAKGKAHSPRSACKDESRKHVAGRHGTPFSQCVSAAAKLLGDTSSGDDSSSDASS
jgi:hypothetical protein